MGNTRIPGGTQISNDFVKTIRELTHRNQIWKVFADFCEMAALSLANGLWQDAAREARYLGIVKSYSKEEVAVFPRLLGLTVCALEDAVATGDLRDFLGDIFSALELSSHWHGQFFTPAAIARVMALMTVDDGLAEVIAKNGFARASDPACGAGATIIGLATAFREKGFNYQTQLHVTAVDVDATAAYMCYIQLSLLHIPAVVIVGNSLSLETREVYRTPAHDLGLWDYKLRRLAESDREEAAAPPSAPDAPAAAPVAPADAPTPKPSEAPSGAEPQIKLF